MRDADGHTRHEQYSDSLVVPLPGQPLNPSHLLNKAVCNVITSLIYARRFEYGDPQLTKLLKMLEENMGENTGLFPEVGGSGQPTEPHLCCPSSLRKLCAKAMGEAFWESTAGGKAWTLTNLQRWGLGGMDKVRVSRKGENLCPLSTGKPHKPVLSKVGYSFCSPWAVRAQRLEQRRRQVMGGDKEALCPLWKGLESETG